MVKGERKPAPFCIKDKEDKGKAKEIKLWKCKTELLGNGRKRIYNLMS